MKTCSILNQTIRIGSLVIVAVTCHVASGQVPTEWIGGDGLWSDQAMWTAGAPDDSETHQALVDIAMNQESIVSGAYGAILSLNVTEGDTVKVGFETAVPGSLSVMVAIVNQGTIEIEQALFGFNQLIAGGPLVLVGPGTVVMRPNSQILFDELDERPFSNIGNTIEGTGEILGGGYLDENSIDFTNTGIIDANVPAEGIRIAARVANAGGTIGASNGGHVLLENLSRVNGGKFLTDDTGTVQTRGTVLVGGVILDGNVEVLDPLAGANSVLVLGGAVENRGELKLDTINTTSLAGKRVAMKENLTLSGGGTVTLLSDSTGLLATIGSERFPPTNLKLTNVDNTIQGSGSVGDVVEPFFGDLDVDNSGDIVANVAQQELLFTSARGTSTLTNTGNMRATAGGQLGISEMDVDNTDGMIVAENNSLVSISERFVPSVQTFELTGGTLSSVGTGRFVLGGNVKDVVTVANCEFRALILEGTIRNGGTLKGVSAAGFSSNLALHGNVVINGGGTICLSDVAVANESAGTSFINQDNVLAGTGDLFATSFDFQDASTIAPGTESQRLGALTFTGDASVDAVIKIDAIQPGDDPTVVNQDPTRIDVVRVDGTANVGATFELAFLNQLAPAAGDFFDVFSATSIPGSSFSVRGPIGYSLQAAVVNLPEEGGGSNRDVIRVTVTEIPPRLQSTPGSFVVTRGTYVSGTPIELAVSDNLDLSVRRNANDLQGIVQIDFEASTPTSTQSRIDVTLESSVFARSRVDMEVFAFNYQTSQYVSLGIRPASRFNDSIEEFAIPGDPTDYVQAGTMKVRTKYVSAIARQQFTVNIDHLLWTLVE
jgi:hypothetical protein